MENADNRLDLIQKDLEVIRDNFPRIARAIELLWGADECDAYLNSLIIDSRGGREGFSMEVMNSLLHISRVHFDYKSLDKDPPYVYFSKH